jgi:hypothetical protein
MDAETNAGSLRLRPGLAFFPMDDELVVFSEATQCLVGLNASAAFVLRALQGGSPPSDIAHALASEELSAPEEADGWVSTTLAALSAHGMLADDRIVLGRAMETWEESQRHTASPTATMRPYAAFTPAVERCYRLLETCALIRFAHFGQARLVNAVIGHLETDRSSRPTLVIDIQAEMLEDGHLRSDVYRDGAPVVCAPRLSMLGPVVKGALWQSAVNAHDFIYYIHAGVVGTGAGCILLPAAAGSGKSSLTAALTHAGFQFFSDEVALIERKSFRVPPMPLAICVKSTGWDLIARYYPAIPQLPTHWREDGKMVRYIPPPPGAAQQPPAPVRYIIFPHYEQDAPTGLTTIARSEALRRLMDECLALSQRLSQTNVQALVNWIADIQCYSLKFSSLDRAVELIRGATLDRGS